MANFPTSVYTPASKSAGNTITASFFNDPDAELTAIETALLASWTTFSPTITGSTSASGQTYAHQKGRYLKVGKVCHVYIHVELSALGTITGDVQIGNLPFTSGGAADFAATCAVLWRGLVTSLYNLYATLPPSSTVLTLRPVTGATASSALTTLAQADLQAGSRFYLSFTYETV